MIGKAELLEQIAGVNRGLLTDERDRLSIQAAIAQLEDRNPTRNPVEAVEWLEGNWRLLYTTSRELLGLGRFPIVQLGQIYQCIRIRETQIYNIAELQGIPFLEGIVTVCAQFTPITEQRVQVQFQRSVIGLQRVVGYQSPTQWIDRLNTHTKLMAIDFTIDAQRQPGWLDITYLDRDLRIGRGNEGNLFVLTKTIVD
ncbi:MAG: fibrillin [Acaryochloridaceae cyanobacterium RU_4_10]|nr:fibrillin [Acaryochloridaceae cyanobacterium RU_4_10]